MAWTTPRTWVAGEILTAANMNTHLRDNVNALRDGGIAIASQAALDFIYASSATQLARLVKGSGYQVPRMNSGASAWEFAGLPRLVAQSVTSIGNILAGTDDLIVLAIPASTLAVNGERLIGQFEFTMRNSVDSKDIYVKFGTDTIFSNTGRTTAPTEFIVNFTIARTGAATQKANTFMHGNGVNAETDVTSPTQTLSSAIDLKAQAVGVATDDVVCRAAYAMWLPAAA